MLIYCREHNWWVNSLISTAWGLYLHFVVLADEVGGKNLFYCAKPKTVNTLIGYWVMEVG